VTLEKLAENIEKTAKARFNAAKRLEKHHKMSQWTVTIASVCLLLIPLLQAFGVDFQYTNAQLNVIQVISAVVVLVFGLLIGLEDHSVMADQMHRCGMELNDLHRRVGGKGAIEAEEVMDKYDAIVGRYKNHEHIDYLMMRLLKHKEYYPVWWKYILAWIMTHIRYCINFSTYIILLALFALIVAGMFVDLLPTANEVPDSAP
jgi:hypothetical protein